MKTFSWYKWRRYLRFQKISEKSSNRKKTKQQILLSLLTTSSKGITKSQKSTKVKERKKLNFSIYKKKKKACGVWILMELLVRMELALEYG